MSTLITGAAGFIGSSLADNLLAKGECVIGIDNFDPYYPEELKRRNIQLASLHPAYRFHEGDIRDAALLHGIFRAQEIHTVVHCAAKAGVRPSLDHAEAYADVNIRGTLVLLDEMLKARVRRMIFASSSSVYGNNKDLPFRESHIVNQPISPYAATKMSGELLCHSFHYMHGLDIWCLRFFTVYGPRQRPEMAIAKFLSAAASGNAITVFGDGTLVRDFTYVQDIVDGVQGAMDVLTGYRVVNIGGAKAYTINQLIETVETVTGVRLRRVTEPRHSEDMQQTCADTSLAQSLFGFQPRITLEEGLLSQWEWMNAGNDQ
jgi:UDP-glucuronate 4-epimerase